LTLAYQQVFRM